MEIKEEEAKETFFQAIYEKIGKATYDWTPQDFLEFLQIIDFTQSF